MSPNYMHHIDSGRVYICALGDGDDDVVRATEVELSSD